MITPPTEGSGPEQLGNQCCSFRITQRRKGDALSTGHPAQRPSIFGAVGDQHQRGRLRDHREELGQHRLADLIDPVRVLNDIDRWGVAGQRGGIDQRGQPPPPGIGIDLGQLHLGIGDAQQVIEEQQVLGVCVRHPGAHSLTSGRAIQITHTDGCPQQPRHDMEGNRRWRAIRSRR